MINIKSLSLTNGKRYVIGWGEGMNLAADYLNENPGVNNLSVAAQYPGFEQYFKGRTVDMGNISQSNYIVFYLSPLQRLWDKDT